MTRRRVRPALHLAAAFAVVLICLLAFAPERSGLAHAATPEASTSCPSETTTCVNVPFPCATSCSVSAGPVTDVGQNQAVYVDVNGLQAGDDIGLAYCSLAQGDQVQSNPTCASRIPPPPNCVPNPPTQTCDATSSPLEWQYGRTISNDTVVSIATNYDPDIPGATPITSQTSQQFPSGTFGNFFCDNSANPCGLVVTDISVAGQGAVIANGFPPQPNRGFAMSASNTVVIPITFNPGGNGCGSAPAVSVDAAYSAAQFLPAAAAATCNGPGGVAVLATDLHSVDDSNCSPDTGTNCPITDVTDGSVPATFTDDPEDTATLAELQKAGGKFAYIPISVSATEIAFLGAAGVPSSGSGYAIPLHTYRLTPAQVAGVLTQVWATPVAASTDPEDDLCGQLTGVAKCVENMQVRRSNLPVETVNGRYENIDVASASGATTASLPFKQFSYDSPPDNYANGTTPGDVKNFSNDTGFALLNPWPFTVGNVPVQENGLGAMFPSTASGTVSQLTGWLCQAPQVPYTVTTQFLDSDNSTVTVNDIMSSQQLLSNAENGPIVVTKPPNLIVDRSTIQKPNDCQALSTLPIDFAADTQGAARTFQPSSSPVTAAHALEAALPNFTGTGAGFDFTAMDSSEADFFGLFPASLQNAAGSFQLPATSSIQAALNEETTNADGTLSPNFTDTGDTNAYPLPMVTYALVSTNPQPSMAQASALKDMLTNFVNYSHTVGAGTTNPLPSGYVPLPDNLYQQALADISNDVVGPGGVAPPAPGSTGTSGASPGAAGGQGGVASSGGGTSFHFNTGGALRVSGASAASGSSGTPSGGTGDYLGRLITVTLGDSRFFIPGLLLLALLCLIGGPLLYLSPSLRKAPAGAEAEGASTDASTPEPGPDG